MTDRILSGREYFDAKTRAEFLSHAWFLPKRIFDYCADCDESNWEERADWAVEWISGGAGITG